MATFEELRAADRREILLHQQLGYDAGIVPLTIQRYRSRARSTAGGWIAALPRRNVLAVGQRSATFLSHVTSIAAEVAHDLSDRAA
jgi:hypothetical protein